MTEGELRRIEAFLYLEARLMDENRYLEWLELFADPCSYWIPSNEEDIDPKRHVSILYADRAMLEDHVRRLSEGKAFAQTPPSRMRRIVSNIEVEPRDDGLAVGANFLVTEVRKRTQRQHAGRSEYRLIDDGGAGLLIRAKKVLLVGIDEPQANVTFLL